MIGLDPPPKRNAFTMATLGERATAYGVLEADDSVRAGVLAAEVGRIGVVQEVVSDGVRPDCVIELAQVIARQVPLGVQATLWSARRAQRDGHAAAEAELLPAVQRSFAGENARESFLARRRAESVGR
jgi:enoyl-CoA hydratase/carnithine racemase